MADLKIIINALNKASDDLDKVTKDIGKVGNEAKTASGKIGEFDKNNFALGLTIAGVAAAVGTVGKAIQDSIDDWVAYNIEVDKGKTATGMAADEYSRIIQAADDARVSQENMTKAMELATKNGYPMSIKSLGKIADELKGIKDPSEKAQKATEIFGRGWADIMPFLDKGSEGIKLLTENIDANMVVTEESIKAAQDYATQVDNMQDAWTGFKNEVAMGVMPVLTDVLTSLVDQITQVKQLKENMDTLKEGVENGTISQKEYSDAALAAKWSTEAGVYATGNLVDKMNEVNPLVDEGAANASMYAQSAAVMKAMTEENAAAQIELAKQLDATAKKFQAEKAGVTALDKNFSGIIGLAKNFDKALEEIKKQEDIMRNNPIGSDKYVDAKKKIEELQETMADLANQVVLDMFQATIAIGGITAAEAEAYFKMAVDMGTISEDAATTATIVYGQAIADINGMKIDDKTGNVRVNVDKSAWHNWTPGDITAIVKLKKDVTEIEQYLNSAHYTTVNMRMREVPYAVGGAVEAGNPYNWQEYGYRGELFVPSTDGFILSRADAERALAKALYGGESAVDPSAIADAVANAVSSVMGNFQRSSVNNFNLTMPTSQSPADIGMAFDLLRSFGGSALA